MPFSSIDKSPGDPLPVADRLSAHVGVLSPSQRDIAYARVVLELWRQAYVASEAQRARRAEAAGDNAFLPPADHANPVVKMGIRLSAADIQAILSGTVPPDYTPESTAARILDVWLLSRDGRVDADTWTRYAADLTLLAHREVNMMLGTLPPVVDETLRRVVDTLEHSGHDTPFVA